MFAALGHNHPMADIRNMIDEVDDDGSGEIEFDEFRNLWVNFQRELRINERLLNLRLVSCEYWFSAHQVKAILERFETAEERIRAFVVLFGRLVDEENSHIPLSMFSKAQTKALRERLGVVNMFNCFQPDGSYYLDLSVYDERFVATMLVQVAMGENARCIFGETYNDAGFQVPAAWQSEVPKRGRFGCTFVSPRQPNLAARQHIAEKYMGWEF